MATMAFAFALVEIKFIAVEGLCVQGKRIKMS
jgi:hypothetical protein